MLGETASFSALSFCPFPFFSECGSSCFIFFSISSISVFNNSQISRRSLLTAFRRPNGSLHLTPISITGFVSSSKLNKIPVSISQLFTVPVREYCAIRFNITDTFRYPSFNWTFILGTLSMFRIRFCKIPRLILPGYLLHMISSIYTSSIMFWINAAVSVIIHFAAG